MSFTTAALTDDLARRMVCDPQPWLVARECLVSEKPMARADLLCMRRRLDVQPMLIFEIKVSRADLLSDLRCGKWRNYTAVAALAFAMPADLAMPMEIPPEAGLFVRVARGWRWERRPPLGAPMPSPYLYRRMALTASDQAAGRGGRTAFGDERAPVPASEGLAEGPPSAESASTE